MDDVSAIKARLPIEELVASYCTLQKKGRNFVALCPFHNDSKPSLLVSPDKGIAFCFACQSGGDIFSFYQKIEGVDFPSALRELADRAGVQLTQKMPTGPKKDDKERARDCLQAAMSFYQQTLKATPTALEYLQKRAVTPEQIEEWEIGVAPDSFSQTYEHLLKAGFSRTDILAAGLGVQKELQEERIYDRFRHRLMFPLHDAQGAIVGFGGRTLGNDDAKYINSSDGILFHKSSILFGLNRAKEDIRQKRSVILVEGYFDVLACHAVGAKNVVATCGTALTAEHVRILRRYAESVVLCMDQDRAGQEAMERSFPLLSAERIHVEAVVLPGKDPSDVLVADAEELKRLLSQSAPYLDVMIERLRVSDLSSPLAKRQSLERMLTLLRSVSSAVERQDYLRKIAAVLGTSETALQEDLNVIASAERVPSSPRKIVALPAKKKDGQEFSATEITIGLFLLYPQLRHLITELIAPPDGFAHALYQAIVTVPAEEQVRLETLQLEPEHRERASILQMFCEHHGFGEWSESLAVREVRRNCQGANKEMLHRKQVEITQRLLQARQAGMPAEEERLQGEYRQVLLLMKKAS